jgi:hypothetical protein
MTSTIFEPALFNAGLEEFFFLKYSESLARVEHNFHQLLFRLFSATANLKTESKLTRLRDYCGLL